MVTKDSNGIDYLTGVWNFSDDLGITPTFSHTLTEQELNTKRDLAHALLDDEKVMLRSCGLCNNAHYHLHDGEDVVMMCFGCGRWWLGNIDISIYQDEQ